MSTLIETVYSGETDNVVLTVSAGRVTVEMQIDPEYMGFPIPDPVYLGPDEARLLADALLRAAEEVPQ